MLITPEMLTVVIAVSNPLLWQSRIALARKFIQHMVESDVKLVVVECAYGERPFELEGIERLAPAQVKHVKTRSKTLVWNKESLLNLGFAALPDDAKYIGWFDADISFRSPSWAVDTVNALQIYDVVQPWSDCYDLGPKGEHLDPVHRSFGRVWVDGKPIMQGPTISNAPYKFAHPGYAWAATRDFIQQVGGLMDTAALGAADHHMAMALINRVKDSIPGNLNPAYSAPLYRWQERAGVFGGNIGYAPGTIEHGFHGPKKQRKYIERWSVLQANDFNPETDLKRNLHGLYELVGNKPELRRSIMAYMTARDEDSNQAE